MASPITPPTTFSSPAIFSDSNLHHHHTNFWFKSQSHKKSQSISTSFSNPNSIHLSKFVDSRLCCCRSNSSDSPSPSSSSDDDRWSFPFRQFLVGVSQKLEDFLNSRLKSVKDEPKNEIEVSDRKCLSKDKDVDVDGEHWNWERWQRHFKEIEDQESAISVLKAQLTEAIDKEDYEDAATLKVAIAAAATKDAVGSVMSYLKNAIRDERYQDAAFMRDNAGAGLVSHRKFKSYGPEKCFM